MTEVSKIRWNSFFSFLSVASRLIANVILLIIITNLYGKEIAGQFTSAIVVATVMITFADFGMDVLLTIETSSDRANAKSIFSKIFPVKIVFSLLAFLIIWAIAFIFNFSRATHNLLLILSFYTFFTALNNFLSAFFRGFELLIIETKVSIISNVSLLIAVLVLSFSFSSIYLIAIAFVLSRVLGFLFSVFYSKKLLPSISFKLNFSNWTSIRQKVFVYGSYLFSASLFSQWDTLLLQLWKGDAAVGVYQAAARIISVPLVIPDIFINSLMPTLSRYYSMGKKKAWLELGSLLNKTLVFLVLPFLILFLVFPEQVIKTIYFNKDYLASIEILRMFGMMLLLRFAFETPGLILTTSNRQNTRMMIMVIASFVSVFVYEYFIKKYGAEGSIMASIITNGLVGLTYVIISYKIIKDWFFKKEIGAVILITGLLILSLWWLRYINFFFLFPIACVVYLIFIVLFGFTKADREILVPSSGRIWNLVTVYKNLFKINKNI